MLYVEGLKNTIANITRRAHADNDLRGSGITIIKTITADWTEEGAERAVTFWLQTVDVRDMKLDLIACQNDAISVGYGLPSPSIDPSGATFR